MVCIMCGTTCEPPDDLRTCPDCWRKNTLIPQAIRRPDMGWTRDNPVALTARQFQRRNHPVVRMSKVWSTRLGPVGERFSKLDYGPPGSLKSTEMVGELNDLIVCNDAVGILNLAEEGFSLAAADRLERCEVVSDKFLCTAMTNLEGLMHSVKKHGAAFIALDSFSANHPNQVQSLAGFHQASGCCLLISTHATKDNSPAGTTALTHYVDIVVRHEIDGDSVRMICEKNRYGPLNSWSESRHVNIPA